MLAIRQKINVKNNKVTIEIPPYFGEEVEVIVLSNKDEKSLEYWSLDEIDKMGKTIGQVKDKEKSQR